MTQTQKRAWTEGEWRIDQEAAENLYGGAVSLAVVDTAGFPVAELPFTAISQAWMRAHPDKHWADSKDSTTERDDDELVANARLIAASPDLYEALESAVDAWVAHRDAEGDLAILAETMELFIDDMKAALKKANPEGQ